MIKRQRDISRFSEFGYSEYNSLEEIKALPVSPGLNSIKIYGKWLDFLYIDRGAETTMVSFSAAVPSHSSVFPVFSGPNMLKDLNVNLLAFYDPACANGENLPTFWHLGTKWMELTSLIPEIVSHVITTGVGNRLLFFGSSAGGFAALNYSSHFPGSVAFVMNPRINLLNAPKRFNRYVGTAYPDSDAVTIARSLPYNQSRIYEHPRGNHIIYLQNLGDTDYRLHHYDHFIKAVGGRSDVEFVLGEWGKGHTMPPRDLYLGRLRSVVSHWPAAAAQCDSGLRTLGMEK